MSIKESYEKLSFDLSGSRTKNRFDFEILYGIELLLDNYNEFNDYTIVFDYVCDIELHCIDDQSLKFYQVKTSNTGKPNNVSFLTKQENKTDGGKKDSIIGKLYKLSSEDLSSKVSVLLVSNVPLLNNDFVTKPNEAVLLDDIEENTKNKIISHLKEETHQDNVNLANIYYLFRSVGVDDYESTLVGKLTIFYENEKNCIISKPRVLFNSIKEMAVRKAKYESKCSFNDLYRYKGISRSELKSMIEYHYEENSEIYENCYSQIISNTKDDIFFQLGCTKSLKGLISAKDQKVINIIDDVCTKIREDKELGVEISIDEYAKTFKDNHKDISFPIYLSKCDIYTIVIYSFEKLKEEIK